MSKLKSSIYIGIHLAKNVTNIFFKVCDISIGILQNDSIKVLDLSWNHLGGHKVD
jgi:hypothetical protein